MRSNLTLIWRWAFMLAAVGSLAAASLVGYGWTQSYRVPLHSSSVMFQGEHEWSSSDGQRYIADNFVIRKGVFEWQRLSYSPAVTHYFHMWGGQRIEDPKPNPPADPFPVNLNCWQHVLHTYVHTVLGPGPLYGFQCYYEAGRPVQSRARNQTEVMLPLWFALLLFLILPLAWARSAWRRRHDHGVGFPVDVKEPAETVNPPTLGEPPPATART